MTLTYPHQEQALYCGCMDGRTDLTNAMLGQYQDSRKKYGEVFRLFWGGGPFLFLLQDQRDFALQHLLLANKVHPFKVLYLSLHMGCGAYSALGQRNFSSREEEIAAKWADLDAVIAEIETHKNDTALPSDLTYIPTLLDLDGSEIQRP